MTVDVSCEQTPLKESNTSILACEIKQSGKMIYLKNISNEFILWHLFYNWFTREWQQYSCVFI